MRPYFYHGKMPTNTQNYGSVPDLENVLHTSNSGSSSGAWSTAVNLCTLTAILWNFIMVAGYMSAFVRDMQDILAGSCITMKCEPEYCAIIFYALNVVLSLLFVVGVILGLITSCLCHCRTETHAHLMMIYIWVLVLFLVMQCGVQLVSILVGAISDTSLDVFGVILSLIMIVLTYLSLLTCVIMRYRTFNKKLIPSVSETSTA
jgi:hypothetical protein